MDVEDRAPTAAPLTSLKQLEERALFSSHTLRYVRASIPLASCDPPSSSQRRPRLLVCHDYKGGYQEDKWIQGSNDSKGYALWHWHLIDVFVYFSHSLVTLPPPGWTNAAHKHGVQVLGTFITEWKEGAQVCRTLLTSSESCRMYASRLAELAQALGFDGWLINIENTVDLKDMPHLYEFVEHLSQCMNSLLPNSLVIWYDAVTEDGDLNWQNCLNKKNRHFFDVCEGIFTNYSWTEGCAKSSADTAGQRTFDVYMGVDIFGRNTYGGGGFQSDVALKVAQNAEVSAALFAPAWVYEINQPPDFKAAQSRWWGLIEQCWPIARLNPTVLPFFSDFDQGCGRGMFSEGKEVSSLPWFNLSCQNLQPLLWVVKESQEAKEHSLQVRISQEEAAFSGGSCIRFSGCGMLDVVLLYHANVPVVGAPLHVSYSVLLGIDFHFCLVVRVCKGGRWTSVLLMTEGDKVQEYGNNEDCFVQKLPITSDTIARDTAGRSTWSVRKHMLKLGDCVVGHIYGVVFSNTLHIDKLFSAIEKNILDSDNTSESSRRSASIKGMSGMDNVYDALLGHIRISRCEEHDSILPSIIFESCSPSWIQVSQEHRFVSLNLIWSLRTSKLESGADRHSGCKWVRYYVYVCKTQAGGEVGRPESVGSLGYEDSNYLGVAMVEAFYVHLLPVPDACSTLDFRVQAQCACGMPQAFTLSPVCSFETPEVWKLQSHV